MNQLINPMPDNLPAAAIPKSANAAVEVNRTVAEVQAAVVLAKQFPRSMDQVEKELMGECSRASLAEEALYDYAKGGTKIEGPSIRLAEAIAMTMGNMQSGWRELERGRDEGKAYVDLEAYCWDLERNRRQSINFRVRLIRNTRSGDREIKDEREIYEHCANQAKRRERAVILAVVPGYLKDMAVDACKETLTKSVNAETIKKMLKAFDDNFGIKKEQIEQFTQCNAGAITANQAVRLRSIYTSLKDGVSKVDEWFDPIQEPEKPTKGGDALKEKLAKNNKLTVSENDTVTVNDAAEEAEKENLAAGRVTADEAVLETLHEQNNKKPETGIPEDFVKLIDSMTLAPKEARFALFKQHDGQSLYESLGKPEAVRKRLADLGVHVIDD